MIQTGARVIHQGKTWVVLAPTSFLEERRYILIRRDGTVRTGWAQATAKESSLSGVTVPTFEIGQQVRLGYRRGAITLGFVTEIISGDRTLYTTEVPREKRWSEEGTAIWIDAYEVTLGPEFIDV